MILKTITYSWAFTSIIFMTIQIWKAYLSGDWTVTIDYNNLGEGMLELIVFSTATVVTILYTIREAGKKMV